MTALLALTSSSRASAIHHLNINFMVTTEKFVQFTFHKLHKSWRRGKAPPNLTYYAFPADPELCVLKTLQEYLSRTECRRGLNKQKSQVLLGHVKPYVEVKSSTVSRWLKQALAEAGIDVNLFKGHSTRSASSSKAGVSGLCITDILKRGSWSHESTWQRFYNKPVLSSEEQFQNAVLSM